MQNDTAIQRFLDWKGTYAPRASVNYRPWLERLFSKTGKDMKTLDLDSLVTWRKHLDKYSPYTIQFAMVVTKNFISFWDRQGVKTVDPSLIRIPKVQAKSHQAIRVGEYLKLLQCTEQNSFPALRDKIMLRLLYETGVRVSELCDLNVTDLDTIKMQAVISTKKTEERRVIYWTEGTNDLILRYLQMRIEINRFPYMFISVSRSSFGERLNTRSVQRMIKRLCKKADITKKISPHSFRHGWAHQRRDLGKPLAFIQKGLGHRSPVSTFVYEQYADPDFEKQARESLSEITETTPEGAALR